MKEESKNGGTETVKLHIPEQMFWYTVVFAAEVLTDLGKGRKLLAKRTQILCTGNSIVHFNLPDPAMRYGGEHDGGGARGGAGLRAGGSARHLLPGPRRGRAVRGVWLKEVCRKSAIVGVVPW